MTEFKVMFDLTNEEYHGSKEYEDYISSSELKKYQISPLVAHENMINPQPLTTPSVLLGNMFHECMEMIANGISIEDVFEKHLVVFSAPVNPSTGKAYGAGTAKYEQAYQEFLGTCEGKKIVSDNDFNTLKAMVVSATNNPIVKKLLKWGAEDRERMTGAEISIFGEIDGVKAKVRCDLLTKSKIVDWKSTSLSDLRAESINKAILNYGYHISAALYQKMLHELTDQWYGFYLVFVQTQAPYDVVVVDMNFWSYTIVDGECVNDQTLGCQECDTLLNLHRECMDKNEWRGAESFISPSENGLRIMTPEPPAWAMNTITKTY